MVRDNVRCLSWAHRKVHSGLPISVNCKLFSLGVTVEVLRAKIDKKQVAQLSQRDRAAGWVINGQKWKTGTERPYLRTI